MTQLERGCLSRRAFLSIVGVGAVASSLVACSGSSSSPTPQARPASGGSPTAATGQAKSAATAAPAATTPPSSAAKGEIVYMHFFTPGDPQMTILPHAQQIFAQQMPNVTLKVEFNAGGAQLETKLETMLAGGTPPDAATVNPQVVLPLMSKGALLDLSPLIKGDAATYVPEDFYPPTLTRVVNDGKQYGIPLQMGLFVLIYNKDLLKAAGVSEPTDAWHWDKEFLEAAQKLTNGSGGSKQYGTNMPPLEAVIWANGGDLFSADEKKCTLDQPAAAEAVQWLGDLRFKYKVTPLASDLASINTTDLFLNGRLAMDIDIAGTVSRIIQKKPKFDWDIAHVPSGKAGRFTIVQGPSMLVFDSAKNKDLGWKWIELYTSKDVQLFGTTVAQVVSARKSADEAYIKLPPPPAHRGPQVDSVSFARQHYYTAKYAQINNTLNKNLDDVWTTNTKPAQEAMTAACKQIDPLLQ